MNRIMRLWDIVFINITAIVGVRWLPIAASFGAASILLWLIAMAAFFIPLGLIATELAITWPNQGGMYVWVREAFGKRAGFMVSWFYWTNNFFYYPVIFTFIAIIVAAIIDPALARNKTFVYSFVIGFLWLGTIINLHGMKAFKRFSNIAGTLGILLPVVILIGLGFGTVLWGHQPIATNYSWANWVPDLSTKSNLGSLAILMFSMAGMELTPIMAGETADPQKTFPRATLISAFFIVGLYILSTVAITFILPAAKIGAASGISDTLLLLSQELQLSWLPLVVGGMIILGSVGTLGVWIVAPTKMLLESCREGILPHWFTKCNRCEMPAHALVVQAVVVTVIVICTSFSPSINAFYEILALMATISYFLPYIAMFLAYFKLRDKYPERFNKQRISGSKIGGYTLSALGLSAVVVAILLPFVLPLQSLPTARDILFYRLELALGPLVFAVAGWALYQRFAQRRRKSQL